MVQDFLFPRTCALTVDHGERSQYRRITVKDHSRWSQLRITVKDHSRRSQQRIRITVKDLN